MNTIGAHGRLSTSQPGLYFIQLDTVVYERRGGGGFTLPEAMRELYGVGGARVLRSDGTTAVHNAGSASAVVHVRRDGTARNVRRRKLSDLCIESGAQIMRPASPGEMVRCGSCGRTVPAVRERIDWTNGATVYAHHRAR